MFFFWYTVKGPSLFSKGVLFYTKRTFLTFKSYSCEKNVIGKWQLEPLFKHCESFSENIMKLWSWKICVFIVILGECLALLGREIGVWLWFWGQMKII